MRKERKFKIEGIDKSIVVYELTVKQIISLIEEDVLGDLSLSAMQTMFADRLLPISINLTWEELLEMAPSEIEQCWDIFREVNASFFVGVKMMGLTSVMNTVKEAIINDFSNTLVGLSKQVIPES